MSLQNYREVLAVREVRRVLLLGFLVRVPLWAGYVALTLHVVTHLGRSYGAAGLVEGAATLASSISSPWRGRRLDQVGLRKAVAPSLIVGAACWAVAPFVGFWPLLALASLAGLFLVPSFTIVRQAVMSALPEDRRKSALSVDSVAVELSYMIGPALGVVLATSWTTPLALFTCQLASLAAGLTLWIANPRLREPEVGSATGSPAEGDGAAGGANAGSDMTTPIRVRTWLTPRVLLLLAMSGAAVLVLTSTDVSVVAALRHMGHAPWIGWELSIWGFGSAVGGLVYGAMRRTVPVPLLLGLLAATTAPVALAREPASIAALLFVTGAFCAPTITATVDAMSRAVPERVRGEALGWHGGAMTAGGAMGAPIAGAAIDAVGWRGGFVLAGAIGLLIAALGAATARGERHPTGRTAPPSDSSPEFTRRPPELPSANTTIGPRPVADASRSRDRVVS